ncbi:transcriptional regulator, GntR family [Streptoalloteichus tenebrarius]|uniref:Transcriptional regulator, GntR family n=1 Tax=Streptoalloteichus tenebrarius (strain ATCC 17920 / DSM 40477 / JCM 4838 / CBS 697.72 / NBRC 16177 / NCIMB 11028 / NRRL B-12390 / A12253. 1 / ISP 5477) TaxID=1933 RepID=A0ABT1HTK3_STRSD|nr:FadR/GntR family transcriptional regulator [Streptoalloteichus tenebrarius]MCP2258856.1 transcriptional regulator, GntR family [Streptoalloteichus tenebrarius]BFE99460.1 FadR/GntR family transcriptional regulator [Streptoalloteichus tenebrarius]
MSFRRIDGSSRVSAVAAQLHEQLSSGNWVVGQRIPPEDKLAEALNVSRPAVREAIRGLVQLGILEARQGAGTYVRTTADPLPLLRQVRRAKVRDIVEVQLGYDIQAARFAAERRTEDDLRRLRDLLARRDSAETGSDPDDFAAQDARFHLAVAEAAHNPVLLELYRYFLRLLEEALHDLRADQELPRCGLEPHRALVDAIEARDPDGAERAVRRVVEPGLTVLNQLLD